MCFVVFSIFNCAPIISFDPVFRLSFLADVHGSSLRNVCTGTSIKIIKTILVHTEFCVWVPVLLSSLSLLLTKQSIPPFYFASSESILSQHCIVIRGQLSGTPTDEQTFQDCIHCLNHVCGFFTPVQERKLSRGYMTVPDVSAKSTNISKK